MTKQILIGLLLLFLCCQAVQAQQRAAFIEENVGKKYAVLIGVNDYVRLSKLRYAKNDIEALRDELSKTGFEAKNVYTLTCGSESKNLPTKENIELVVDTVFQLAQKGDVVLIAMSGHGIEFNGEARFCPPDTNPGNLSETTVSIKSLFEAAERSKATFKLMIVDACRDNPLPTRSVAGASALQTLTAPPDGVMLLQSTRKGQQSYEDSNLKRGVFTHYLVEGLQGKAADKEGRITLMGLTAYAMKETPHHVLNRFRSQQQPYLRGEITDFVLTTIPASSLLRHPPMENKREPVAGDSLDLSRPVVGYSLDLSRVRPGELPKEWVGPNNAEVNNIRGSQCLTNNSSQAATLTVTDRFNQPGDFVLSFTLTSTSRGLGGQTVSGRIVDEYGHTISFGYDTSSVRFGELPAQRHKGSPGGGTTNWSFTNTLTIIRRGEVLSMSIPGIEGKVITMRSDMFKSLTGFSISIPHNNVGISHFSVRSLASEKQLPRF